MSAGEKSALKAVLECSDCWYFWDVFLVSGRSLGVAADAGEFTRFFDDDFAGAIAFVCTVLGGGLSPGFPFFQSGNYVVW